MSTAQAIGRALKKHLPTLTQAYRQRRNQIAASTPVETPYGFKLACPPVASAGEWYVSQVKGGEYEREETQLLAELIKEGSVFVDIGANVGWFTCLAASRGLKVVAFEPKPENILFLKQSLLYNDFLDIEMFPMALARKPELRWMYGSMAVSSLMKGWQAPSEEAELVPVTTLDIALGGRFAGEAMMVKMDVEGAEWEVLGGAAELLQRTPKPQWLIEVILNPAGSKTMHPNFAEVFELFYVNGYRAQTADQERREILRSDIERWLRLGKVDFGGTNYLFSAFE